MLIMWTAKYKKIDTSGLNREITVLVAFTDGNKTYEMPYEISPSDLDSDKFKTMVDDQLQILNAKSAIPDVSTYFNKPITKSLAANEITL